MSVWLRGIAVAVLGASAVGVGLYLVPSTPPDDVARTFAEVQRRPRDPSAWLELGDAHAAADAPEAAELAFRNALRLSDQTGRHRADSRLRLGFSLYSRGQDVEARRWLMEAQRLGAEAPLLNETLHQLAAVQAPEKDDMVADGAPARSDEARPAVLPSESAPPPSETAPPKSAPPPSETAPIAEAPPEEEAFEDNEPEPPEVDEPPPLGPCAVELERRPNGAMIANVGINGVDLALLVDTGATITVLNMSAAADASVRRLPGRFRAHTANGTTEMGVGAVDRVDLQDRAVGEARVALCDECIVGVDGLFGVDLQSAFDVQVDVVASSLLFADCR